MRILCLDFDGVICDSVLECLVSSWIACFEGNPPDRVPLFLKQRFLELRPFIRSGEDYVLIQRLLEQGRSIRNQEEFDDLLGKAGALKMAEYKERFYSARESLFRSERDYWFGLNRLYPHVEGLLKLHAASANLHIVSTKRPDFISEILGFHGIRFNPARMHYASSVPKLEIVNRLADENRAEKVYFVDDQIDHLTGSRREAVEPCLASWGYVKPEWLGKPTGVRVLEPIELRGLFELCG